MIIAATMYSSTHSATQVWLMLTVTSHMSLCRIKWKLNGPVFVTYSHILGVVGLSYKQDSSSVLPSFVRQDMSYAAFVTATAQSCTTPGTRDITTSCAS